MEEVQLGEKKPNILRRIYGKQYKYLMIVSFAILILAISQLSYQMIATGSPFEKSVDLKGGIILEVNRQYNPIELEKFLIEQYPKNDINVRLSADKLIIEADIAPENEAELVSTVEKKVGKLTEDDYSSTLMGPSLSASFFRETSRSIIIAFLFMGMVVFWYFSAGLKEKLIVLLLTIVIISLVVVNKSSSLPLTIVSIILAILLIYLYIRYSIPSFAVVLCAFSDIIFTLAVVNILGIKIGTAGIAAFLMLIGYSVDTDILLSTRVLKRTGGTVLDRTIGAAKTGLMMSATTIIAVAIALAFVLSLDIKQIMVIVLIGLCADLIFTWLQNAGLLRWYIERKSKKEGIEHVQA